MFLAYCNCFTVIRFIPTAYFFSKLIGCERCMREFPCELDAATANNAGSATVSQSPHAPSAEMQAYWQCEHGLWAFSERTEDCACQTGLYRTNCERPAIVAEDASASPAVGGSTRTLSRLNRRGASSSRLALG